MLFPFALAACGDTIENTTIYNYYANHRDGGAASLPPAMDAGSNPRFETHDGGLPVVRDAGYNPQHDAGVNHPPILGTIENYTVSENELLTFTIPATDEDGDNLLFNSPNLPQRATLERNTGIFQWTPDFDQNGSYEVTFRVSDRTYTLEGITTITVLNRNQAPILSSIGDKVVNEGEQLCFVVTGQDADGDLLHYSAQDLPTGATASDSSRGFEFCWTPTYLQAGTYPVSFSVSDDASTDIKTVSIIVRDVPQVGRIVFTSVFRSEREIFVMGANGNDRINITNYASAADYEPKWSPDGTMILFTSERNGNSEIYLMNGDGSGQVRLTENPGYDFNPSWSPDGTKIAYTSDRCLDMNCSAGIFVTSLDSGDITRLVTLSCGGCYGSPAWSPDGTKIAYVDRGDIYTINNDGSDQRNITSYPGAEDFSPAWSPNGSKIAFVSRRNGNPEIYIMNADGTEQTNITNSPSVERNPDYSPDGTKIIFDDGASLYVIDADGSNRINITNGLRDNDPDWGN